MKKNQYHAILRYHINGSPTSIEVTGGLTSENGPIPGAVVEFVEDGCDLFTLALDLADLDALVDMLVDTIHDQRVQHMEFPGCMLKRSKTVKICALPGCETPAKQGPEGAWSMYCSFSCRKFDGAPKPSQAEHKTPAEHEAERRDFCEVMEALEVDTCKHGVVLSTPCDDCHPETLISTCATCNTQVEDLEDRTDLEWYSDTECGKCWTERKGQE